MKEERLEILMVRVVDDVASPAERQELMSALSEAPEIRREYESHLALKATTDHLIERLEVDLATDEHQAKGSVNAEIALGWLLFFSGLALVLGFVVFHFLSTPGIPLPIRLGIAAMSAGGLMLMASAIRARIVVASKDRYSEITR